MSTFAVVHGAGDSAWSWRLVADELRVLGHRVVVPDLPVGDSATLDDYADAVVDAVGPADDVVVVGHSFGAFTAPLVASRVSADLLVLVAGMVPRPGEKPDEWWGASGYVEASARQAARVGGLTGNDDPYVGFFHDVPRDLTEQAMAHARPHPSAAAMAQPWPLDSWPDVPTRFLLCRDDRLFPADLFRRLVPERLGLVPDEIDGSHCVMLSRPGELAQWLSAVSEDATHA